MKYEITITKNNEKVCLTYNEVEYTNFCFHIFGENYDGSFTMNVGGIAEVKEVA